MSHDKWGDTFFLGEILKSIPRIGWHLAGVNISNYESVASHSWGVAYISILLCSTFTDSSNTIDVEKILTMAIIHDLPESIISDIPHKTDQAFWTELRFAKRRLEKKVIQYITTALPNGTRIIEIWKEYDTGKTLEAQIVQAADILDMLNHALLLEKRGIKKDILEQFFQSGMKRLQQIGIEPAIEMGKNILAARTREST